MSRAAFTEGVFNNPTSMQLTDASKQFDFARFFDLDPRTVEDYKELLTKHRMSLIYLEGAEKAKFANSPDVLNQAWTIFANGRFEQVKI